MSKIGWFFAACASLAAPSFGFGLNPEIAPQTLVIFGATGDLTKRGLVPALVRLAQKNQLPEAFSCIGVGLGDPGTFRQDLALFLREDQQETWDGLKAHFSLIPGFFEDDATFQRLEEQLREAPGDRLFYLAVPPSCFAIVIEQLHKHQLLVENKRTVRVVIEKPFGFDSVSAAQLQQKIASCLKEHQVFRMDHFLGIEVAKQLLSLRFSNPSIESVWNREHIDHVAITVSEQMGIGSRGLFWEQTGYLRDVVQNHMMQLVSLIGMEKPADFTSDSIQKEKQRLLQALCPIPKTGVDSFLIRGQYGAGEAVRGYRKEPHVPPDSSVETAIAGKLFIDNERWQGVPFYLKGGKRLSQNLLQVALVFKPAARSHLANQLVFQFEPTAEIYLSTLHPDGSPHKQTIPLDQPDGSSMAAAYEFLLNQAMRGDQSHFVSYEEIAASWDFFAPAFEQWKTSPDAGLIEYTAGSDGPLFP